MSHDILHKLQSWDIFLFQLSILFCLQYSPVDHSRPTGLTPNRTQGFRHAAMPEKLFTKMSYPFFSRTIPFSKFSSKTKK